MSKPNLRAVDNQTYRDLPMPTKIQMHTVVKGDDRYQPRRFPWLALFAVIVSLVGLVMLIASAK